jgi:hypothetical protein
MDVSNVSNDIPAALAGTGVKSLSFDGSEEYVVTGSTVLNSYPFSLSVWFRSTSGDSGMLVDLANASENNENFSILYSASGTVSAWLRNGATVTSSEHATATADNGEWHHAVAVFASATSRIVYYDADQATESTDEISGPDATERAGLGASVDSSVATYFNGVICDPRIYNKALSATEVAQLAAGTDVTDGLVSRWKFDDQWNTFPGDGEPIASWTCRATGAVFTQDTAASRPIYRAPGSAIGNAFGGLEFDGTDDLLVRTVANWLGSSSGGFIVAVIKPGDTGINTLFSTADEALTIKYLRLVTTGTSKINQRNADTLDNVRTGATDITAAPYIVAWDSSGTAYTGFVQGDAKSLTVDEGANSGDWFADTADRDNVTVGALKTPQKLAISTASSLKFKFTTAPCQQVSGPDSSNDFKRSTQSHHKENHNVAFCNFTAVGFRFTSECVWSIEVHRTGGDYC